MRPLVSISTQRILFSSVGLLGLSCVIGVDVAHAQTAGTAERTLSSRSRSGPPVRAEESARGVLPLIDPKLFPPGSGRLKRPAPTETPGASGGSEQQGQISGRSFGATGWPFTTARVAVTALGPSSTAAETPVTSYPFRATGKLFFRSGEFWFVCTASLIKKGLLVTAAHCLSAFDGGKAGLADEAWWSPGHYEDVESPPQQGAVSGGAYGWYRVRHLRVPRSWRNGTDTCFPGGGVICSNDLAVATVKPKEGVYAGQVVGWYGYGWNGYSYAQQPDSPGPFVAQITQLGYPVLKFGGYHMIRSDSRGEFFAFPLSTTGRPIEVTQIGSAQTGGSSGGPWLVNFGTRASEFGLGQQDLSNIVVGVTSYAFGGQDVMGASWFGQNHEFPRPDYDGFGAGNIGKLVRDACTRRPQYC